MKLVLWSSFLAVAAYAGSVAMAIAWDALIIGGVKFDSMLSLRVAVLVPEILFYGTIGVILPLILRKDIAKIAIIFSVCVLLTKWFIPEWTYYGAPTLGHYIWISAQIILPSIAVLSTVLVTINLTRRSA